MKRTIAFPMCLAALLVQVALSQDSVDVTFRYTPPVVTSSAFLAGEFNNWSNLATPMSPAGDNTFVGTVRLVVGGYAGAGRVAGAYQYKFYYPGVLTWPNDPLNHLVNSRDNNNSYVYVNDPTIYQLIPNERSGVVPSATPTVSAYIFPKVGSTVDTSSITLKVGSKVYTGLGRYFDPTSKLFSFPVPDPLPNGANAVALMAGKSVDSVSVFVQGGFIEITNLSGFVTRNPLRTLYGIVQDTAIHEIQIVDNSVDTSAVPVSAGEFSFAARLHEGNNSFKAIAKTLSGAIRTSDTVSFTYLVNHAPDAAIYYIDAGPNIIFNGQGIDPDSGQSATFLWLEDAGNPQHLAGFNGSTQQQLSVPKPKTAGEYFVTLIASDPDGNKDTTRSFFTIQDDGTFQGSTLATVPSWARKGRLYELLFKSFTPQGTIAAAIPRLSSLKNLGVNILWVMPIMENAAVINNQTGPGYNIKNFLKVAPEYGTLDDFRTFVSQAHALGLKVIVDVTPNHTSYLHPFAVEARQFRENSPHWSFYQHERIVNGNYHPNLSESITDDGFVYYSGFSDQLLNYNWSDIDARTYMIEVYKWWIRECNIDGYRFDVYWGPHRRAGGGDGNELEMGAPVRKALKKLKPDIVLLAEDDATGTGSEAIFADRNGGVDAAYDWALYGGAIQQFSFDVASVENLHAKLYNNNFYPGPNALAMRFMENHDEERIVVEYQDKTYQKSMPVATTIFTAPGIPLIYSGQEVGYGLGISDFYQRTRGVIDWLAPGRNLLLPHYQRLATIRSTIAAFSSQKFLRLESGNPLVYAFVRPEKGGSGIVAVNFSATSLSVALTLQASLIDPALADGRPYVASDLYNDTSFSVQFSGGSTSLHLTLKPYGSSICVLADTAMRLNLPSLPTSLGEKTAGVPASFSLAQNYPNPFNPTTTIAYDLPGASKVTLTVFNILGEVVSPLFEGRQEGGHHLVQWNGTTASGAKCSSGVYFVMLESQDGVRVLRMMLVK